MEANTQKIEVTIAFPEDWDQGRIRQWLAVSQKVEFVGDIPERWNRQFIAYFLFVGWEQFSLGITVDVKLPNFEIHVPFGFIKVGWVKFPKKKPVNMWKIERRQWGLVEQYE